MGSPVIELLTEVVARITKAKTDEKLTVSDIFIGDFEQIRNLNDLPIVVVAPNSYASIAECMGRGLSDNTTFSVVYVHSRLANNNNKMYNTTTGKGIIYEVDQILNYVEKKTSDGAIDLTLNGKAYNLLQYAVNYDYSTNDVIKVIIRYTVKTQEYLRGAR